MQNECSAKLGSFVNGVSVLVALEDRDLEAEVLWEGEPELHEETTTSSDDPRWGESMTKGGSIMEMMKG